ncbi:MAG: hypothetical protein VX589_08665 [Myxococcota bacterium]|nr:hypothetical protein [Myxococcota bacterium]
MLRTILSLVAMSLLIASPALADDSKKSSDFAHYSVNGGISPFGGSINVGYNSSEKTSWLFGFGGAPAILELDMEIDGTDYTVGGSSAWTGFFVNHRPFDNAMWFRFVAGVGIGNIENELDDGNGNVYRVDYNENPVGYWGIGFGNEAKKGFLIGFDIGLLFTAGPDQIRVVEGAAPSQDHAKAIEDFWLFGNVLPNFQLTMGYGF